MPKLANFGQRLGAWLLDGLILWVPGTILFIVLVVTLPTEEPHLCEDFEGNVGICEDLTGGSIIVLLLTGLAIFAFLVYFWWGKLGGERGQTPGKMAVGIKVVGMNTGEPVGMGKGIGRGFFQLFISGLFCWLGYWWMLWDDKNQTWHDKVVDSLVISER